VIVTVFCSFNCRAALVQGTSCRAARRSPFTQRTTDSCPRFSVSIDRTIGVDMTLVTSARD